METDMILIENGEPFLDWSRVPSAATIKVTDNVLTTGERQTASLKPGIGMLRLADRMDSIKTTGLHEIVVTCGTDKTHTWIYRPRAYDPYRCSAVKIDWRMENAYVLVQIRSEIPIPAGRLRYRFEGCPMTFDLGYVPPNETRWSSFYCDDMEPMFYIDDSKVPPMDEIQPERFAKLGLGIELHIDQIV